MQLEPGDIILYKNGTGWFSKVQHWINKTPYNHSGLYAGELLDIPTTYEQTLQSGANPFVYDPNTMEIWRMKVSPEIRRDSVKQLYQSHTKRLYAFLQLINFLWAAITGRKRNAHAIFVTHAVCSEEDWEAMALQSEGSLPDLYNWILGYNSNVFHPGYIKDIIIKFAQYFEKVENPKFN